MRSLSAVAQVQFGRPVLDFIFAGGWIAPREIKAIHIRIETQIEDHEVSRNCTGAPPPAPIAIDTYDMTGIGVIRPQTGKPVIEKVRLLCKLDQTSGQMETKVLLNFPDACSGRRATGHTERIGLHTIEAQHQLGYFLVMRQILGPSDFRVGDNADRKALA